MVELTVMVVSGLLWWYKDCYGVMVQDALLIFYHVESHRVNLVVPSLVYFSNSAH